MDHQTTRRRAIAALGTFAGATAVPLLSGCGGGVRSTRHHVFEGATMGTRYRVDLVADEPLGPSARRRLRDAVHAALAAVDGRMSTFDPDSELSRFNRDGGRRARRVSDELLTVVAAARQVSALSDGAFDVTVGPLVEAWGFGAGGAHRVPAPAERRRLGAHVGHRGLVLDAAAGTLRKDDPALRADLSGIAKGHGVDAVARVLDAAGVANWLVDVGGELRARGRNGGGERWRVGIERPEPGPRRAQVVLAPGDRAIATSGDYRHFFEHGGERYAHGIDPATGAPARHALASVSVVAPDCARADAWSTALFVLGPRRGERLALSRGLAACFVVRERGGVAVRWTPAFAVLGPIGVPS